MTRSTPLFLVCACLISLPALAQIGGGSGSGYGGSGYGPGQGQGTSPGLSHGSGQRGTGSDDDSASDKKEDKPIAPPPAIPGAQPDADAAVIPADKLAAEMSPNDALFDAINRGDLAAAKDALSRGAQLEAHNVLGQTPTDAAIDLSRNDITFLLLSMRGAVSGGRSPHAVVPVAVPGKPVKGKREKGRPVIEASAARMKLPTDRGTPNPSVGFIGF